MSKKKVKSGDHALVLEALKIEGQKEQVNVAQGKEFLKSLKTILACDEKLRRLFLASVYNLVAEFEISVLSKRKVNK